MSNQQKTIGLFYRHPEAFIKMISWFYPLSPAQIKEYSNTLDFKLLSGNPNCTWDDETVQLFIERIVWSEFSSKSSFFSNIENIEKYKNYLVWGNEKFHKDNQNKKTRFFFV